MNATKAIKDLVQKKFRAVLSNEEAAEFVLLLVYEIETNLQKLGIHEIISNTFDKYVSQRKPTLVIA